MKTKDLTYIGLSVALISIAAQITIPINPIPITLQVLAISLISYILNTKQAVATILIYITLGLIGFPVFSFSRGGIAILGSPTFGFILGFIPFTYLLSKYKNPIIAYLSLYITALSTLILTTHLPISTLILMYWLPFVITDSVSIYISYIISAKVN